MPELPDVETFRIYFNSTSLHKKIKGVEVKSTQILDETSEKALEEALSEMEFTQTRRHGKYLFATVNEGSWLVFHFGMTGSLKYFKDIKDDPAHDRFLISFENGYHLAFDCQRKFGRISISKTIDKFLERKELGPDCLELNFEEFKKIMENRRGSAKYTLMNQHIIAGLGNIYSDEVLFQARIHPRTEIKQLDQDDLKELFNKMRAVLKTAIDVQADPERFPQDYLLPHRSEGENCPDCSGEVKKITLSGRSTYFCPSCQKRL